MKLLAALALTVLAPAASIGGSLLLGSHHVVTGLPGAAGWRAAVAATAPGVTAPDPSSAAPAQVRRFFAGLTPVQRAELEHRDPGVVGNLDGTPVALRYAANDLAVGSEGPRSPRRPLGRLLGFDPRGAGRGIEVFGDLTTAEHIAVVVPGVGWTLSGLLADRGNDPAGPVTAGLHLYRAAGRVAPSTRTAVVVWLGYDPPAGIDLDAVESRRAIDGAGPLRRFVEGLPGRADVSLVCHSYGAVVCGRAARAGARVDELVAVAAPGMDASSAGDLGPLTRVWAALDSSDPMRFTPFVRIAGLGHGADPTDPAFGALVFRTGTAHGHAGYFSPGTESLTNLARIVTGRTIEVTLR